MRENLINVQKFGYYASETKAVPTGGVRGEKSCVQNARGSGTVGWEVYGFFLCNNKCR